MGVVRRLLRRLLAFLRRGPYLPSHLAVGANAYISRYAYIDWNHAAHIVIEDHAVLAPRCAILAHDSSSAMSTGLTWVAPVHLKRYCYIGYGAIVLPGVTVGERAVVGAGSVVTSDVPDGAVVAGAPARVVGEVSRLDADRLARAEQQGGVFPADRFMKAEHDPVRLAMLREAVETNGGYFTGGIHGSCEDRRYPVELVETI